MSMNKPMHFFSSSFMFLNTDFRMKTKIEMNMYEYANELIFHTLMSNTRHFYKLKIGTSLVYLC